MRSQAGCSGSSRGGTSWTGVAATGTKGRAQFRAGMWRRWIIARSWRASWGATVWPSNGRRKQPSCVKPSPMPTGAKSGALSSSTVPLLGRCPDGVPRYVLGQQENFLFCLLGIGTPRMRHQALDAMRGPAGRFLPDLGPVWQPTWRRHLRRAAGSGHRENRFAILVLLCPAVSH